MQRFKTTENPVVSFEVPKSRFSAFFSKNKTRTFFLKDPDPLSDSLICRNPAADRIAQDGEVSKTELARILAISITSQKLLFVPGFIWGFSKYLEARLDFDTLLKLGKIAVLFSSYSNLLQPLLSEREIFLITRNIYNR